MMLAMIDDDRADGDEHLLQERVAEAEAMLLPRETRRSA